VHLGCRSNHCKKRSQFCFSIGIIYQRIEIDTCAVARIHHADYTTHITTALCWLHVDGYYIVGLFIICIYVFSADLDFIDIASAVDTYQNSKCVRRFTSCFTDGLACSNADGDVGDIARIHTEYESIRRRHNSLARHIVLNWHFVLENIAVNKEVGVGQTAHIDARQTAHCGVSGIANLIAVVLDEFVGIRQRIRLIILQNVGCRSLHLEVIAVRIEHFVAVDNKAVGKRRYINRDRVC